MTNVEAGGVLTCSAGPDAAVPAWEVLTPRDVHLGPRQEVRRVLPSKDRRLIGAWCFVDHYGPEDVTFDVGMRVPPHPHTGLQTVSWLFDGEIEHRDSLGSHVQVRPGQLNLMTAGPGIAHSEESVRGQSALMHGVQLWVALPDSARHDAPPAFSSYTRLPRLSRDHLEATVIMGELEGRLSPATTYSPIVAAELSVTGPVTVALRQDFEYGVIAVDEGVRVNGERLAASEIGYVGGGRSTLDLHPRSDSARVLLIGGEPFAEELVMWWNFIGRSHDEIVGFREEWNAGDGGRFGVVRGFSGDRLLAPPLPNTRLRARGRVR